MLHKKIFTPLIFAVLLGFSNSYAVDKGSINKPDSLEMFKDADMSNVHSYKYIPDDFRSNLGNFYNYYFEVSENLSAGDSISAKRNAMELFDMSNTFMNDDIDSKFKYSNDHMRSYRSMIEDANTLEQQRSLFGRFSNDMSDMIDVYGLPGQTIYVMETDDAITPGNKLTWLSNGQRTSNPYYGTGVPQNNVRVLRGWNFQNP
jgi:hypothetical protein